MSIIYPSSSFQTVLYSQVESTIYTIHQVWHSVYHTWCTQKQKNIMYSKIFKIPCIGSQTYIKLALGVCCEMFP